MAITQSIANVRTAPRGIGAATSETAAPRSRITPPTTVAAADVKVTLSPDARQHMSRTEGFAATIGTDRQPRTMGKPGMMVDLRV